MSGIDREGQGPREMAGLLDQIMLSAPGHRGLEVCIECVAVQLHQVQDGCCQGFDHLLCEGERVRKAAPLGLNNGLAVGASLGQ